MMFFDKFEKNSKKLLTIRRFSGTIVKLPKTRRKILKEIFKNLLTKRFDCDIIIKLPRKKAAA